MIPTFPEFKSIDLEDKPEIEEFTSNLLPYSDFNFTSMWAWDTKKERLISKLNGNLVVRFTDYLSGDHFFSFFGNIKPEDTARELIKFAEQASISPVLKLVTEEVVKDLDKSDFIIEEDRDNFDYVFSVSLLKDLRGVAFKTKRHLAENFLDKYPDAKFVLHHLGDSVMHDQIKSVFNDWKKNKDNDALHEEKAFHALLSEPDKHRNILFPCIMVGDRIVGFAVEEILSFGYAVSHFFKVDKQYRGGAEFLNRNIATYLYERGVEEWNWQQDLGIQEIKRSKMSYRPIQFLKKYKLGLRITVD